MSDRCLTVFQFIAVLGLSTLAACTGVPLSPAETGVLPLQVELASEEKQADVFDQAYADDCIVLGEPATETHQAMFDALNSYRAANGLSQLKYSRRLEAAADLHVRDLYARGFFDHTNPDGQSPSDRAVEAGFCHPYVGENIAAGQPHVQRVMTAWEESPPHDKNMLEADFVYVGMGHYTDPNGRQYWGQVFAFEYP